MLPNVVIFTTGSSGSSVLAGILARQGFWVGHDTARLEFNTFENADLVKFNIRILNLSGHQHRDANDLPPPSIYKIAQLAATVDPAPYVLFTEECERHRPWLWKDPRLAFTVHFWKQFASFNDVRFLVMLREFRQAYAGMILKRKVYMHPLEYRRILQNYEASYRTFLETQAQDRVLYLTFEDLILEPTKCISKINRFLGTSLSVKDVTAVYRGALCRKRYGRLDYLQAVMRYYIKKYLFRDVIKFPRSESERSAERL